MRGDQIPLPSLMERVPDIRLKIGYGGVLCTRYLEINTQILKGGFVLYSRACLHCWGIFSLHVLGRGLGVL